MPTALILPTSGPYTATWNALAMGTQNDDGFIISCTVQGQEINASDAYGMTLVEAIYRGQNWRLRLRGLEWAKPGLLGSLQMFGQTGATTTLTPTLAGIGGRWSAQCQTLLLSAILSNPPAYPQSLTALNTGLAPNNNIEWMHTSKMREMPMEFVLLPYTISGPFNVPFTTT